VDMVFIQAYLGVDLYSSSLGAGPLLFADTLRYMGKGLHLTYSNHTFSQDVHGSDHTTEIPPDVMTL
jgi:hypothetical protein